MKNKIALLVTLVFAREYPTTWPTFMDDMLALMDLGETYVDMFLRVAVTLDEEIVGRTIQRTAAEAATASALVRFDTPEEHEPTKAYSHNVGKPP